MLIPEEPPYLSGLNSYYLSIDRFVEHLQGEIGSGCLYCQSAGQEVLVYFDEHEVIRGVIQKNGEQAYTTRDMAPVLQSLTTTNFAVTVYSLDPNAIFFWGQMPPFKRAQKELQSIDIRLPDLVFRLNAKKIFGFVRVKLIGRKERALLFLHKGKRLGGSYSWGKGGLDSSDESYNKLLQLLQSTPALFSIGHFQKEQLRDPRNAPPPSNIPGTNVLVSDLDRALEEFLHHFTVLVRKKTKSEPIVLLKQEFINNLELYPFLDPFKDIFDYVDGKVHCSNDVGRDKIAAGVVECAWKVIQDNRLEQKFATAINGCESMAVFDACNIPVQRL